MLCRLGLLGRAGARLGAFALALWLLAPTVGRAWTDAHVREAHAALALSGAERVAVELELLLEVRGGWLEQLELPGLDEGLVLAEQEPALAMLESGEQVPAQVSLRGSTLSLKFARRDGLRRGEHRVRVRYSRARAASGQPNGQGPAQLLYWTLPGFEAGLRRASVRVLGPRAMRAVEVAEVAQSVTQVERGREQLLTFTRVHVPRATPWTITVELPASHGPRGAPAAVRAATAGARGDLVTSALLVLASLGLAMLMQKWVEGALRVDGFRARGLGLARPLSLLAMTLLSVVAALSFAHVPTLSLLAWSALFVLGVPQATGARGPLALGSFRPLARKELRGFDRARWLTRLGVPWADAHSLLGSAGVLALLALPALRGGIAALGHEPWGLLALCAALGVLVSAHGLRPRSLAEQVGLLVRAARSARTVGCALRLVAYDSQGRLSQPRLRLEPGVRYPGLLRLEVLVDTRRSARPLVLSALVEGESAAERWLNALWPHAHHERGEGGRRVALLVPIDDVGKASEALLEHLGRESQKLLFAVQESAHAA